MRRATYPKWKTETVEKLVEKLKRSKAVGVVDFHGLPARLFQRIRRRLSGQAEIVVTKNTLIALALQRAAEEHPKLAELSKYLEGQSALVFTDLSPFELNKLLRGEREKAPAKLGAVSSVDVVIKAGETDFPPGPIVSELQRMGVKAKVQAGKVVVSEDFPVVRVGEVITREMVDLLNKLGIEPVELFLRPRAIYEKGLIFSGDVLDIDEKVVSECVARAHGECLSLALNIGYPTAATVMPMLIETSTEALALALSLAPAFFTRETLPRLIARARSEMLALALNVMARSEGAIDDELKEILRGSGKS